MTCCGVCEGLRRAKASSLLLTACGVPTQLAEELNAASAGKHERATPKLTETASAAAVRSLCDLRPFQLLRACDLASEFQGSRQDLCAQHRGFECTSEPFHHATAFYKSEWRQDGTINMSIHPSIHRCTHPNIIWCTRTHLRSQEQLWFGFY